MSCSNLKSNTNNEKLEKLGLIEPTDLSDNQRVFWGTIQEPVLRVVSQYYDLYGEKNNYLMNMKDFNISSSNTRSGYKVNIDGGNNKVYRKHLAFDYTTQNKKLHVHKTRQAEIQHTHGGKRSKRTAGIPWKQ